MRKIINHKVYFWLIPIILVLLNILLVLWMERSGTFSGQVENREPEVKAISNELNLTTRQKNLFNKYEAGYYKLIHLINLQIKSYKEELLKEIFKNNADNEKINILLQNISSQNNKKEELRFNYLRKMKSLLNNKQTYGFKKIIDNSLFAWSDSLLIPGSIISPPRPRKIF